MDQFKFFYGQGGTLNFNNNVVNTNLKLQTIWEDFTIVEAPKNINCEVWENENQCQYKVLENQQNIEEIQNITCQIPEYYNYNIINKGNVVHEKTYIDAKLYGNVNLEIVSQDGKFECPRMQTEFLMINTKEGDINITKSLESKQGNITSQQGNIYIKKLSSSGQTYISTQTGNIKLDSTFTNVTQILQNLQKGQQKQEFIKDKTEYIQLQSTHGDIQITYCHGNIKINKEKTHGDVTIKAMNVNQAEINGENVLIDAILGIKESSYLEGKVVEFKVNKEYFQKFNIYDQINCQYLLNEYNEELPTLTIESDDIKLEYL